MKIDVFPHILPRRYFDRMLRIAPPGMQMQKRMAGIPVLVDVDLRFRMMDRHEGYVQVLTIANPPIEVIAGPAESPDLARLANDEMAALVARHPDRFPGFVASLPMNAPDAALAEIDRAVDDLGATGVQVFTNVNGRPLDRPEHLAVLERMAARRLPVWMHPARPATVADYVGEPRSKYDMWWAFGWPYETSVAMGRLVFSGIFDRHPDLAVITHHMGAMIPYLENRIGMGMDQMGTRTADVDYTRIVKDMKARGKRPLDYFHLFYADTSVNGSCSALRCGLDFFGPDRSLFGTDCPFDPQGGPMFIREGLRAIDELELEREVLEKLMHANAERLLRLL
jgi:predicted TIM-barrel fold metal-dependent hydrolase